MALPEVELLTGELADPEQRATSANRVALAANSHAGGWLIEDTWTSGGNTQSVGLTLRREETASVAIELHPPRRSAGD